MSPLAGVAQVRPWSWWARELSALAVLIAFFATLLTVVVPA